MRGPSRLWRFRAKRPASWIPAPRFHEDKLRGNDTRGAQRGKAPLRFFSSPKIEDPPQEEWDPKGVEKESWDTLFKLASTPITSHTICAYCCPPV